MDFEITFSDNSTKKYAGAKYRIEDNGTVKITDGDDILIYAPHAWSSIKTAKRDTATGHFL